MTRTLYPVAILAGGLATRLRPLTDTVPKSLIPVAGQPFIFHQLQLLRSRGIERATICTGFRGEMIEEAVGTGDRFDLSISYSSDGSTLLGTAGALKKALPLLGESFFVMYGDSYLPCDFSIVQHTFDEARYVALMTVFRNKNRWDTSNVEFSDNRLVAYDKVQHTPRMHHIDYGLGVFRAAAFDLVLANVPCDLSTLYQALLANNQLGAFEVQTRFYEIGSPQGLEEMRDHVATFAHDNKDV